MPPKKINHIQSHDSFFKKAMSNPKVAKEFFDEYLPSEVRSKVDLNTLKPENESFLDNSLGKGIVDMLFSVKFGEEKGYFYILLEHQSKPDYWMPFRIWKYMLAICSMHRKKHPKSKKLPIIYPMIYYAGLERYTAPLDLWSLFTDAALAKKLYTGSFQLIELQKIEDEELKQRVWCGVMQYVMKRIFARDIFPFLEAILPLLKEIGEKDSHYIIDILWYTSGMGEAEYQEEVFNLFKEAVPEEKRSGIMTIADQLIQKGREEGVLEGMQKGVLEGMQKGVLEGMQKGMRKGVLEGMQKVALNMFGMGQSISFISKATGLSELEIEKLCNEHCKRH